MTRIVAGDSALMTVVEADASLEQVRRTELAAVHLLRLRQAIAALSRRRGPGALRRDAVQRPGGDARPRARHVFVWLASAMGRPFSHAPVAGAHPHCRHPIVRADARRADLGCAAQRAARRADVALLAMALLYLGFVLAQFPWTRGVSQQHGRVRAGAAQVIGTGIVANIPSLVFLTVLFFVVRVDARLTRLFFDAVESGRSSSRASIADWAQPTYKIVRVVVIAFGLIVAYPYIPGSESAAFKGVSLFIGIVFSLGSSATISNIIAGYMMTYRRAFKVGDRIKVGDAIGDVIEMRLQVTHLRSVKNEEIIVPNSQILTGEVLNYSSLARAHGLILHTEVGIGYETPWRQVEAC